MYSILIIFLAVDNRTKNQQFTFLSYQFLTIVIPSLIICIIQFSFLCMYSFTYEYKGVNSFSIWMYNSHYRQKHSLTIMYIYCKNFLWILLWKIFPIVTLQSPDNTFRGMRRPPNANRFKVSYYLFSVP